MSVFVYAAPSVPTPVPVESHTGITDTWTGPDGSIWDMSGRTGGVAFRPGVRGRHTPEHERQTIKSPGAHGSRWVGRRTAERQVFWPIRLFTDGSDAWLDYDSAFWSTLHPDRVGRWTVTRPDGSSRWMECRFDTSSEAFTFTPGMVGWADYDVYMVAEDPFWRGQQVVREWDQTVGEPFFGGASGGGFAPPFFIGSSQTLATATVDNPGDEPASVVWWVESAATSAVGVGGLRVTVPFEVAAGRLLVLDGSPDELTAVEIDAPPSDLVVPAGSSLDEVRAAWVAEHLPAGTDRTTELDDAEWAQIPAGESTVLSLEATGAAARITARFTPAYHRAW